jgi:hypothetical protein
MFPVQKKEGKMPKPLPEAAGSTDQYIERMADLEGWNLPPESEMFEDMVTDHVFKDDGSEKCVLCPRPSYEHSLV